MKAEFVVLGAGQSAAEIVDYLHTNQLERPLFMTDSAGVEVYRWQPTDAFGVGTHNTDVDGNGQHRDTRLGLPGQQWDSETSTWYNYFRDYNGRWGRYTQSDPIGLAGGINLYVYALDNPLAYFDPDGADPKRPPDWQENLNRRKGSENRQPSGERERNVRPPKGKGEEHSIKPKGGFRPRFGLPPIPDPCILDPALCYDDIINPPIPVAGSGDGSSGQCPIRG